MAEPFDQFAARVVRNREYQVLIDAIIEQGGDLESLVSAVNAHRYKIDEKPADESGWQGNRLRRVIATDALWEGDLTR